MITHPFIADLVLLVVQAKDGKDPTDDLLRQVARHLDCIVLVPDVFEAYASAVRTRLAPWHVRQSAPLEAPYLREPKDLDNIASVPFRSRSVEWLREHDVHLLALNLPAIEGIQDRVLEDALPEWVALFDNPEWLREFGLAFMKADDLGAFIPHEVGLKGRASFAGSMRDAVGAKDGPTLGIRSVHSVAIADATSAEPFLREAAEKSRRVLGDEDEFTLASIANLGLLLIEGRENVPFDAALFEVERAGRSLTVRSGGLAFVRPGCTLTLRWLQEDGQTINGQGAVQTIRDRDEPVELAGECVALRGQVVEFEFERTGYRPYKVRGRFRL